MVCVCSQSSNGVTLDVEVDNNLSLLLLSYCRQSGMLLTMLDVPTAGRELKLQAEVFEMGNGDDDDGKFNTTGTLSVATVMVFCE